MQAKKWVYFASNEFQSLQNTKYMKLDFHQSSYVVAVIHDDFQDKNKCWICNQAVLLLNLPYQLSLRAFSILQF